MRTLLFTIAAAAAAALAVATASASVRPRPWDGPVGSARALAQLEHRAEAVRAVRLPVSTGRTRRVVGKAIIYAHVPSPVPAAGGG